MDIKNRCLCPVSVPSVTGVAARVLRCGQCPNCLKQKANELAVRAYREFVGQDIAFLTFTYDNAHCPIKQVRYRVDISTGEFIEDNSSIIRDASFFNDAPFDWKPFYKGGKRNCTRRYKPLESDIEYDSKGFYFDVSYPTVYYEDIKLMLKRFRERYPKRLNQFICVPEYGSNSFRPHYHMLLMGLSHLEVESLVHDWSVEREFGSVDVRYPKPTKDNSLNEQISKMAMYVAKYCTKGKFDCPYISKGLCNKPKRAVSKNFGIGSDFAHLKRVVLCEDTFHFNDAFDFDVDSLTIRDINLLISRRTIKVNSANMPFPKYLIDKIFKRTIKVYTYADKSVKYCPVGQKCSKVGLAKVTYHQVSSPLQTKIASVILADLVADYNRSCERIQRDFKDISQINDYYEVKETDEKNRLSSSIRQFQTDMSNSSYF